jgi:hypothetical protein
MYSLMLHVVDNHHVLTDVALLTTTMYSLLLHVVAIVVNLRCVIFQIYDQSKMGNHIGLAPPGERGCAVVVLP